MIKRGYLKGLGLRQCRRSAYKDGQAFSLVTVTAMGAVVMTWLFAVSAAVLPMFERTIIERNLTVARSAAEAGLDFIVAELNAAAATGVTSPFDDGTEDMLPKVSPVPASVVGNSGAQVTVSVNNAAAPSWSALYDELKDASNPDSIFFGKGNKWRTIIATASYGGLTRSIQVVLQPIAQANSEVSAQAASTAIPYFNFAVFARSAIKMIGNAKTDGYDSRAGGYGESNVLPTGANVAANNLAELAGNAHVGGDVLVFSKPVANLTNVVATGIKRNTVINDQLIINGVKKGFRGTAGASASEHDNVLGMDRPRLPPDPNYHPILESQTNQPVIVPPAPAAPAGAAELGALSASSDQTLRVPPGDYKVNSIQVSGQGKIMLVPDANGNYGPVRLFVEGNSLTETSLQIYGKGIVNPSAVPAYLQIFYNGQKNAKIGGSTLLYGTLYAPNASVEINNQAVVYGGVVAEKVVASENAAIHFDKALKDSAATWGLSYTTAAPPAPPGANGLFTGYHAVSWQEL